MRPFPVVAAIAAILPLFAQTAQAEWQVRSEFQLHLTEDTFDKMIQDFWQSLQGTQKVAVGNVPVDLGDTKLAINGINVAVNYSFPLPTRIDTTHRIWDMKSTNLGAAVTVDQLVITRHQVINIGGVNVDTPIVVVCNNIALGLPAGQASIEATVEAQVVQNQVQLTMPTYNATWPSGAWQISSLNCPELASVSDQVKAQILGYLSSFQNLDSAVSSALTTQFTKWSQQASLLLLSQQQLPTKSDYLKIFYEPETARENNGNGLILTGHLRFDYPFVAQGQNYLQEFPLPAGTQIVPGTTPQLIVSFSAIKTLMMGEYFAGKLEYTMPSSQVTGFQSIMSSFWLKLFGWPDLLSFPSNTSFLFQFLPMGPPSFLNEAAGGTNVITGDLTQPVSMRMFAPKNGQYTPYVEFRTTLAGPATMTLGTAGQINFKINAADQPVQYAFAQSYIDQYNPNKFIAINTIAKSARTALNTDGLQLTIPPLTVGASITLAPNDWQLQPNNVIRLDFSANSRAAAPAVTTTVKTTNNRTLSVTSARSVK
ncbi:MAG: hypothetical protein ACXWR1_20660 [Bdellovibrionota bacterium]